MPIHPAAPSLQLAQVDEEGAPMLDWGLAVEALNKVDAGVPEKVSKLGGWVAGVVCDGVVCHVWSCWLDGTTKPSGGTAGLAQQLLGRFPSLLVHHQPTCLPPNPPCTPQVLLMSRDEMSMLVVSYSDIRRCIASCYEELRGRASTAPGGPGGGGMQRSRSRPSMQQQY